MPRKKKLELNLFAALVACLRVVCITALWAGSLPLGGRAGGEVKVNAK